jgi:hypothetical protein
MMTTSYILGQKHYPVPYARKKLIAYLAMVVAMYGAHRALVWIWDNRWFNLFTATLLFVLFALFIVKVEKKELERLPFIGRLIAKF